MPSRRFLLLAAALCGVPFLAGAEQQPRRQAVRGQRAAPSPVATGPQAAAVAAPPPTPANTPIGPVVTAAQWAIVVDYNTGTTLLDKNADEPMTPSSMTKLMTLYIVFSQLKTGQLRLDQTLPVSARAWRMGGSKMFVKVGTDVTVQELIQGVIVDSGNDACIVLADGIAGSEAQFVDLMNQEAKRLGLQHSTFRNCTGWPEPGHQMSVRDIATVAIALIRDFPQYYHFFDEKTFTYSNIHQMNRNELVDRGTADGLKTGHTEAGGYGLVASAEHGGRRVVVVLNGMTSIRERAAEGERILDWAFSQFEDVTLFTAAEPVAAAPVWLGTQPSVPLVSGRDVLITLPRGWRNTLKVTVDYPSPVAAPVEHGQVIGQITVSGASTAPLQLPLLAGTDVPKLALIGRAWAVLRHYVTGI
jgi:D-alanyl-D-alanine carboxypeptidase (penicillin-binding protein 5/6)